MSNERVTRDELEEALRAFVKDASKDVKKAKTVGLSGAAAVSAAAVAAAYAFGRRRGEHEDETYVEVQRIS